MFPANAYKLLSACLIGLETQLSCCHLGEVHPTLRLDCPRAGSEVGRRSSKSLPSVKSSYLLLVLTQEHLPGPASPCHHAFVDQISSQMPCQHRTPLTQFDTLSCRFMARRPITISPSKGLEKSNDIAVTPRQAVGLGPHPNPLLPPLHPLPFSHSCHLSFSSTFGAPSSYSRYIDSIA